MGGLMNEKRAVRVLTLRTIAASVIGMSSLLATDARAQLSLQEQIDQLSNAVGRLGATADSLAGSINNINDRLANSSLPSPGTGQNSVALGKNSNASATDSTALGNSASATGDASVALGKGANASADQSMAAGTGATASGANSSAVGVNASATGVDSTALGNSASATGDESIALGKGANASQGRERKRRPEHGGRHRRDGIGREQLGGGCARVGDGCG
ncbi:hypothetical protein KPA94_03030 [Burkholderia semiarida]|uniref:hypothetical protein n=1 Tax=Burkholderia semiarida TaxID=2843303 RepID=UPI0023DDF694|nr:hypothetical protein [Burkholderia semiarida]MDF3112416.1 hypothetical protein [Burkholderia semiarida]